MIMKKLVGFIVSCIVIVAITGCSDKEAETVIDNQTEYIASTEYQYYLHEQGRGQGITETNDGYYMINGSYLYYVDKKSMKPILLDQNPNNDCSPSNADVEPQKCSAYINVVDNHYLGSITYYKDYLYLVTLNKRTDKDAFGQHQYVLMQMNKDGSKRKVLRKFDSPPMPVVIHRDQIYYVDNITKDQPSVLTVPLANPEQEATVLHTTQLKSIPINNLIAYGSNLYISESGENMYRAIKVDFNTNESYPLYSEYEGNAAISSISQDKLYFSLFTGNTDDEKSLEHYSSNLEGTDVVKLPVKLPIISWMYADNDYRYLNPVSWYSHDEKYADVAREMVVYDLNYKKVNQIDMSMMSIYGVGLVGNNQHMFFRMKESTGIDQLYYLDKSKLSSGNNVKLQLLLESAIHF